MLPEVAFSTSEPPSMVMVPPLLSRMVMAVATMLIALVPLPVRELASTATAPALVAVTPALPPAAERKLTSRARSPCWPMPFGALMSSERATTLALLRSVRPSSMLPPAAILTLLPPASTLPSLMEPSASIWMSLPVPPLVTWTRDNRLPLLWRA